MLHGTQIEQQLMNIIDPDLNLDIVTCGFVKNVQLESGSVTVDLLLTTPACPMKSWFEKSVRFFVSALVWVSRVEVRFLAETVPEAGARKKGNAEKGLFAKHVVLVSSCKGGVGKSTLSVNLAYILKARGCAVAICDLDVYGPSFSVLLPLQSVDIEQKVYFEKDAGEPDNKMVPLEYGGVKLMSASYILAPEQFNGVRGAMAARLCNELLFNVRYGPLDYLIVDTPPGTGDVHISLVEELEVDGVLVVSNPAELSYADVQRGIRFYETFNVPILGVIYNKVPASFGDAHARPEWPQPARKVSALKLPYELFPVALDEYFASPVFQPLRDDGAAFPFAMAFAGTDHPVMRQLQHIADRAVRGLAFLTHDKLVCEALDITNSQYAVLTLKQPGRSAAVMKKVSYARIRKCCVCWECRRAPPTVVPRDLRVRAVEIQSSLTLVLRFSDAHTGLVSVSDLVNLQYAAQRAAVGCVGRALDW